MIAMMIAFAAVLVADQISKAVISAALNEGMSSPAILGMRFTHVMNRRRQWKSAAAIRVMAVALLLMISVALLTSNTLPSTAAQASIGAILGGAAGNLFDGFNRRAVVDFIDLRVWPVFNIADAAIVTGAAWIFWYLVRG